MQMWPSFPSIHHCGSVCGTKAVRLWLNVFVIKHYWLPPAATVDNLGNSSSSLRPDLPVEIVSGSAGPSRPHSVLWVEPSVSRGTDAGGVWGDSPSIHFHHKSNDLMPLLSISCASFISPPASVSFPSVLHRLPPSQVQPRKSVPQTAPLIGFCNMNPIH